MPEPRVPDPDQRTLALLGLLSKALLVGAAVVLVLALLGAVTVAGSQTELPGVDQLQRESRGPFAFGVLAAGITGAGVLAGLGGIIRLLLLHAQLPPADDQERSSL